MKTIRVYRVIEKIVGYIKYNYRVICEEIILKLNQKYNNCINYSIHKLFHVW